ncbi:hypothetical protein BH11PLA1_BH11PLA1_10270 [soil metagenome]
MGIDLLAKLNAAQNAAVVHDRGPLIVLAGPGTGKTRVIIHRVAHLVLERGVAPESVLAVTFTKKAAGEMKSRLEEVLAAASQERGVGLAAAVHVETFNALGMRLLMRHGHALGLPPTLTMIDSVQRKRLIGELMEAHGLLPHSHARGRGAVIDQVERALGKLNDSGVEPAAAQAGGDALRRSIESNTELGEAERAAALIRWENFDHVAKLFGHLRRACIERGWITFDDQIALPSVLLRDHPRAAALLRGDVRHIVVDEFQDMNAAQIELLRLLAPPSASADVCIVGDDDQSIYKFRGADDRAFETFARLYPAHTKVRLEENYRSRPGILAASNAVIAKAARRFDAEKTIRPARPAEHGERAPAVRAIALESDAHAGDVIAALLRADRAANPTRTWSDYAIITRGHTQLDRAATALEIERIPSRRRRGRKVLDHPAVRVVSAWVAALLEPRAAAGMREVLLRGPVYLAPGTLLALEHRYGVQASHAEHGVGEARDPGEYLAWLAAQPEAPPPLGAVAQAIDELRGLLPEMTASEAIARIIQRSGVAHAELLDGRARAKRVAALVALLRNVRERQERLEAPGDLATYWADYEAEIDSGESEDTGGDDDREAEQERPGEDGDGAAVMLLTAHSAKGLEFPVVFVAEVSPKAGWPSSRKSEESEFVVPGALLGPERSTEEQAADRLDEERRLFYVACTRAEEQLYVLARPNAKRSRTTTHFFEELTLDEPGKSAVVVNAEADVLRGGPLGARSELEEESVFDAADSRREYVARVRAQAREEAARALDALDRPGLDSGAVAAAESALTRAGQRLGIISALAAGETPSWLTDSALQADAQVIAARLKKTPVAAARSVRELLGPAAALAPLPKAPLRLSYSQLDAYRRCPMCYYLKYIWKLPEAGSKESNIGTLAHGVLERFYRDWTGTVNEGLPRPGRAALEALAQRAYRAEIGPDQRVDHDDLNMLLGQVRLFHERLHDETHEIAELEKTFTFPFEHGGHTHTLTAKLDRVDRMPGGVGVRVVDYKTGQAWKKLREPARDDLQLGVYALALDHVFTGDRGPDGFVQGQAEYWLLSTGERGVLPLSSLKRDKVREQIAEVIDGIVRGDFSPGEKCGGDCVLLLE